MNSYTDTSLVSTVLVLNALAHENRLRIVYWLSEPKVHFPPQVDGDLVEDGVCVGFITEKIKLKQPTVTNHMKILQNAGLVESKKIKNWVFYKLRNKILSKTINELTQLIP